MGTVWPFVDRDHRLEQVLKVVGGVGASAVVVSGMAGVGRTRLMQEALRTLAAQGRRTEWVSCTRGTAALPLGALAHLVSTVGAGTDLAAAWRALVSTLAPQPGNGSPVIVGIDDAHLLSGLCATLVHKIVLTQTASVVLTVPDGAPALDVVDALWKDGLAARVDLPPLSREHVEQLLTAALGGVVESRTCERLWRTSRGSAVLLHELVEAGRETGHLDRRHGLWRWEGATELTPRLRSVVQAQLGTLTPPEQAALELLSVGGALDLPDLVTLASADVIAALERRGLVAVGRVSRRSMAVVAQPLHAQFLVAQLPEAVADQHRRRLAVTAGVQRWLREDPVRVSSLLLEPDVLPREPGVLARAATQANRLADHELAERLARSAVDQEPDGPAAIALAESLRWQGRHTEAEQVAREALPTVTPGRDREGLDTTRVLNLFYGLGRVADAWTVTEDHRPAGAPSHGVMRAVRGVLLVSAGHARRSAALADELLSGASDDPRVRLWASVARTGGLALLGHVPEALESAAEGWRALAASTEQTEATAAQAALAFGELLALEVSGRLKEHRAKMDEFHETAMAQAASAMDGVAALGLGSGLLAAGRPGEAVRWLTEAAATLVRSDPIGSLRLCLAKQAQAHALLGDPATARTALDGARAPSPVRVFDPEVLLAESWLAAAEHREAEAVEAAMRAAAVATWLGQRPVEARALHTAARLGRVEGVTDRLRELSEELDDRLLHAFAAQADAAARGSGERLDDVASEFSELGAQGLAADAAAQAAEAHRGAGHRRQASASASAATSLARSGGGIRTPALEGLVPYALTTREREVATLASQGVSNQEIARRLVLSVRTIETHLARVYHKLGINGWQALRDALGREA